MNSAGGINFDIKFWLNEIDLHSFMNNNLRSILPDSAKLISLRQRLGWTQQDAATKAGYSDRLIRKIEKPLPVRPQTLRDVVQCYLNALGKDVVDIEQFICSAPTHEESDASCINVGKCPLADRVREYYDLVYQQREIDRIQGFACENIRFTGNGVTRLGIDVIRQRAAALLAGFDPIIFSIDRIFTHHHIVVSYWSVRMKHTGVFLEIPATDRWVNVRGNSLIEFAENLAVEAEDQFDVDDLVRQITGKQARII